MDFFVREGGVAVRVRVAMEWCVIILRFCRMKVNGKTVEAGLMVDVEAG